MIVKTPAVSPVALALKNSAPKGSSPLTSEPTIGVINVITAVRIFSTESSAMLMNGHMHLKRPTHVTYATRCLVVDQS